MRDDFTQSIKEQLAKRVGFRCSNSDCRLQTSGPQSQDSGAVNIGVAAHITAAASGGPRFNSDLTPEERKRPENGIWLCQTCAKLIDSDGPGYPEAHLREWKEIAEATALIELKGLRVVPGIRGTLEKIEADMPVLFAEMRADLKEYPLYREFILKPQNAIYNAGNNPVLSYFFEEHPDLRQKVRILENNGFVQDITYTNVDRFTMSEELVEYLKTGN